MRSPILGAKATKHTHYCVNTALPWAELPHRVSREPGAGIWSDVTDSRRYCRWILASSGVFTLSLLRPCRAWEVFIELHAQTISLISHEQNTFCKLIVR